MNDKPTELSRLYQLTRRMQLTRGVGADLAEAPELGRHDTFGVESAPGHATTVRGEIPSPAPRTAPKLLDQTTNHNTPSP